MQLLIRFTRDLNAFLKHDRRNRRFSWAVDRRAAIKDIIESLGVPHTEVGQILFNGDPKDFSFIPEHSGRIDVNGIPSPFDVRSPGFLRPRPVPAFRFVADVNVMKLGRLLILLGFDTRVSSRFSDQQIADLAESENRIVLTRDTLLLNRKKIVFGRWIRSDYPYDQLAEVIDFFGLKEEIHFFSRCSSCNILLEPVDKEDILELLEPKTKLYFNRFLQCPSCRQVFWKGSHCDEMSKRFGAMGVM